MRPTHDCRPAKHFGHRSTRMDTDRAKGTVVTRSVSELLERFVRRIEDKIDAKAIHDALAEFEAGETISLDELRAELRV